MKTTLLIFLSALIIFSCQKPEDINVLHQQKEVLTEITDGKLKWKFEYNSKGKVNTFTINDAENNIYSKCTLIYNSKNLLIQSDFTNSSKPNTVKSSYYYYNEMDKLIKITFDKFTDSISYKPYNKKVTPSDTSVIIALNNNYSRIGINNGKIEYIHHGYDGHTMPIYFPNNVYISPLPEEISTLLGYSQDRLSLFMDISKAELYCFGTITVSSKHIFNICKGYFAHLNSMNNIGIKNEVYLNEKKQVSLIETFMTYNFNPDAQSYYIPLKTYTFKYKNTTFTPN